jgi:hypothetical protein
MCGACTACLAYALLCPAFAHGLQVGAINATALGPAEFLAQTGLYGIPNDLTGTFVGLKDYRSARGPVDIGDPQLLRLQALFDAGEACYPESD